MGAVLPCPGHWGQHVMIEASSLAVARGRASCRSTALRFYHAWPSVVTWATIINTDLSFSRTTDPDVVFSSNLCLNFTMTLGVSTGYPAWHGPSGSMILRHQHGPRCVSDHKPRHGFWQQPRPDSTMPWGGNQATHTSLFLTAFPSSVLSLTIAHEPSTSLSLLSLTTHLLIKMAPTCPVPQSNRQAHGCLQSAQALKTQTGRWVVSTHQYQMASCGPVDVFLSTQASVFVILFVKFTFSVKFIFHIFLLY